MGTSAITGINLGVPGYVQSFASGTSLVATHNLNSQYVDVTVYDENNIIIIPDNVTATDANTVTVDVSSFTVAADWQVVVIDKGATANINPLPTDLNMAGQTTNDVVVYDGANWVAQAPASAGSTAMFSAYLGSPVVDIGTGNTKLPFDAERFDIGSNFDVSTNIFTAPEDGQYYFATELNVPDITSSVIEIEIIFTFTGVNNNTAAFHPDNINNANDTTWHLSHSMFTTMSTGHSVAVHFNTAGSTLIDLSSGTNGSTFFGWKVS